VLNNTDQRGVHFVMADGVYIPCWLWRTFKFPPFQGFSVEGQENIQEVLSKRLYLCQFLAAMMILRPGGHFVCKLFDVFTPFSAGLVYLMYRAFHRVSLFKPVTSRPANSERWDC
jgi:cap1 methyltransferase